MACKIIYIFCLYLEFAKSDYVNPDHIPPILDEFQIYHPIVQNELLDQTQFDEQFVLKVYCCSSFLLRDEFALTQDELDCPLCSALKFCYLKCLAFFWNYFLYFSFLYFSCCNFFLFFCFEASHLCVEEGRQRTQGWMNTWFESFSLHPSSFRVFLTLSAATQIVWRSSVL